MEHSVDDHIKAIFFNNGTASCYWRANGIADRMNKLSEHEMLVAPYTAWNGEISGANLVILEQLTGPHIVDQCHAKGAKVIGEFDDSMIDAYGRERKNLQQLGEAFRGKAIETIKKCDALTVTTEHLKKDYARFTDKPIYVLQNLVDFSWYGKEPLRVQRTTNERRLLWFGSKGHFEDLRALVPVIGKLLEKYPTLKFVYCGFGGMSSDKLVTEIGWGEDVFRELPRSRREYVLSVGPDYWPMKHRTLDADIGIAPLIDDYFNWNKSLIKFYEYSILETPGVYSNVLYKQEVKHGKTGFIASTNDEWFKYLSLLIEDADLRKKIGKDARHWVMKHKDLDKHYQEWIDVYTEVLRGT